MAPPNKRPKLEWAVDDSVDESGLSEPESLSSLEIPLARSSKVSQAGSSAINKGKVAMLPPPARGKKSTLPKGYCPALVTNQMVRRERLISRRRERHRFGHPVGPGVAPDEEAARNVTFAVRVPPYHHYYQSFLYCCGLVECTSHLALASW